MNQFVREDIVNLLVEQARAQARQCIPARDRAFAWHSFNAGDQVVEQSTRARALRRIATIALYRGWSIEVTKALDRHNVPLADDLPDAAVEDLLARMENFALAADTGCDPDPDQW